MTGSRLAVYAILALAVYGGHRLANDVRVWLRRRKVRLRFARFQRELEDIQTRFVSGVLTTVRPDVPPTWREMVAKETAPLAVAVAEVAQTPCDCPNCSKRRAADRMAVN